MNQPEETISALDRLLDITRILREPGGCDWDRAQDLFSMREYLLEEAAEVIDAVNRRDTPGLQEELGDLLFIVFFLARLNEEDGRFTIREVAEGMSEKLIRRHPHVFGDTRVDKVEDIVVNWEKIKEAEQAAKNGGDSAESNSPKSKSVLKDTKKFLPALSRAYKVQEKVAAVGFDWSDTDGVFAKLREEIDELEAEVRAHREGKDPEAVQDRLEDEAGDLLFAFVNVMRHLKAHPEAALHRSTEKFARRFRGVEDRLARQGATPADSTLAEMDRLWNEVKADEPQAGSSNSSPSTLERDA